jgi:hypothetical protein
VESSSGNIVVEELWTKDFGVPRFGAPTLLGWRFRESIRTLTLWLTFCCVFGEFHPETGDTGRRLRPAMSRQPYWRFPSSSLCPCWLPDKGKSRGSWPGCARRRKSLASSGVRQDLRELIVKDSASKGIAQGGSLTCSGSCRRGAASVVDGVEIEAST